MTAILGVKKPYYEAFNSPYFNPFGLRPKSISVLPWDNKIEQSNTKRARVVEMVKTPDSSNSQEIQLFRKKKKDLTSLKHTIPEYVVETLPHHIRNKLIPQHIPQRLSPIQTTFPSNHSTSSFSLLPKIISSHKNIESSQSSSFLPISSLSDEPLFTGDDLTLCIDKAIKAHEEKLSRKFEQLLNEKLQEQFYELTSLQANMEKNKSHKNDSSTSSAKNNQNLSYFT